MFLAYPTHVTLAQCTGFIAPQSTVPFDDVLAPVYTIHWHDTVKLVLNAAKITHASTCLSALRAVLHLPEYSSKAPKIARHSAFYNPVRLMATYFGPW